MCGTSHFWNFIRRDLWGKDLLTLTCEATGVEVGFLGSWELIQQAVMQHDRSLAELAQDLGIVGEGWLNNVCGGNNNIES